MARHINQRALTVNMTRPNLNPQPRPETAPARRAVMDDLLEDLEPYESPSRLSGSIHLMLTGTSRAGGGFNFN